MNKIFAVLCLCLFATPVLAEELQTDKVYKSGATVTSKMLGLSVQVPKGWKGSVDGEFFVLTRGEDSLVAISAEPATVADATAFLSTPQDLGNGYYLTPTSSPVTKQNNVSVDCTITQGLTTWPGETNIRVGKHGVAVGVIATATKAKFAGVQKVGRSMVRSIKLKKPFVPKPGKSSGPWVNQLNDAMLRSYGNRSSYDSSSSSRTSITLCSGGQFAWHHSGSGFSNADTVSVSYAGNSRYYGKWSVVGSKLHLFYNDGDKDEYQLSTNEQGHFQMNGDRWLKVDGDCN